MTRAVLLLLLAVCGVISATSATMLRLIPEALNAPFGLNPTHYGDPTTGCRPDEIAIRVEGVPGGMCTPRCSALGQCPSDKPESDAIPRCALENKATHERFCALMCTKGSSCGKGASCRVLQGNLGICTYGGAMAPEPHHLQEED